MSIAALIRSMAAAGAPAEAIALAVDAIEAAQAEIAAKRAAGADRVRRHRAAKAGNADVTYSNVTVTPQPLPPCPPKENIKPPLIPQPEETERAARPDCQSVVDEWNAMAKPIGLPPVIKLTEERKGRLTARIAEHGRDAFTEAIRRVSQSPHCTGDNDRGWKANFDFLLQPASFLKIIEGNYDARRNGPMGGSGQAGQPRGGAPTPRVSAALRIVQQGRDAAYG